MAATATTLPGVLAGGPALHALVRVELTNGTVVVGRLLEMDGATMNMKLDAIASTAVRRRAPRGEDGSSGSRAGPSGKVDDAAGASARAPEDTLEPSPVALRCIQGMVVRGACVRFVDFIREGKDGGTSYGEVETAAQQVRPSE